MFILIYIEKDKEKKKYEEEVSWKVYCKKLEG